MNRQQLASKIWQSANKMRSKIEANDYKDYILGFIFYKFLSDKEEAWLLSPAQGWTKEELVELVEEDEETVKHCRNNLGYFISYDNLFSTWLNKGKDFDVANVRDAISAFARLISLTHKKVFENIFNTLETGLSKLGDSSGTQTKAINDLIHLIKDIPMDGKQGYDVLGFIYEYLISMFAANAGKKAGEFYTPHEVSVLMSEIVAYHLKDNDSIEIYDPTSGSGSLLINIGKSVEKHMKEKNKIKYYAQELKEPTYNLTRMNLVMRGILPANIVTRNGDTLEEDWPYFDESDPNRTYKALYVDAVVSNPPYSQPWKPTDKESDVRFKDFGLAPKSKADYAFLLHDLFHVKPDGIMTIVLPHGVLFRGGEEEKIRRELVEKNHIDAIIGLPANIFFGTGIPTIVMVLRQKRDNNDVLIIDASKGFIKVGKNNKLQASNIKKIVDTIISRSDVEKFARVVSRAEIRKNEYNLNIPRYVDSSDKPEPWDIHAIMYGGIPNSEIDELNKYWQVFPNLKQQLFVSDSTPYSKLISPEISNIVKSNNEFKTYNDNFDKSFSDFDLFSNDLLISNIESVDRSRSEQIISHNIFQRLDNITLIDKYKAYQILDDAWAQIETDLEIIQTEGKASITKVDPLIVIKKKGDKEVEVQDGWEGRIIPFEIVQSTLLSSESKTIKDKEKRVLDITGEYQELLDSLSEEDKESGYLNEDKTAFIASEVSRFIKNNIQKNINYAEESQEFILLKVNNLFDEEKNLKRDLKDLKPKLEEKTKRTIETLLPEKIDSLLKSKWIEPIVKSLYSLPGGVVAEFENKVKYLVNKYSTTLLDVQSEIRDTSLSLTELMNDLEGGEYDMKGLEELKNLLKGE